MPAPTARLNRRGKAPKTIDVSLTVNGYDCGSDTFAAKSAAADLTATELDVIGQIFQRAAAALREGRTNCSFLYRKPDGHILACIDIDDGTTPPDHFASEELCYPAGTMVIREEVKLSGKHFVRGELRGPIKGQR